VFSSTGFKTLVVDKSGAKDIEKQGNPVCTHDNNQISFENLSSLDKLKESKWGVSTEQISKDVFSENVPASGIELHNRVESLVKDIFSPPGTNTSARLSALPALPVQSLTNIHAPRNVVPVATNVSSAATSLQSKTSHKKDEDDNTSLESLASLINDAYSDSDEESVDGDNEDYEDDDTSFAELEIQQAKDSNSNNSIPSDDEDDEDEACVNEANNDGDNFEGFSITKAEDEEENKESQTMTDKIKSGAINLASSFFSVVAGAVASIAPGNQYTDDQPVE